MGSRFTVRTPADYVLARDACSYGYFLLAPNVWDPQTYTLARPLMLDDGIATLRIAQHDPGKPLFTQRRDGSWAWRDAGAPLRVMSDRALSRREIARAKRLLTRMLRLDDETVETFHALDPRWRRTGQGRLVRSPTFFEDLVKTVTSCNVAWPSTVRMNERLCEVIAPSYPEPRQLVRRRARTLRARCGVGYRDQRIIDLAKLHVSGEIDDEWLEDPATPDAEVFEFLKSLPGIGPYAAGNLMQLLGRYGFLAIDTESVRHGRETLGLTGSDAEVISALRERYEPFGEHRFRSYWFELWDDYVGRRGHAWEWRPQEVGKSFTAAAFRKERAAAAAG